MIEYNVIEVDEEEDMQILSTPKKDTLVKLLNKKI